VWSASAQKYPKLKYALSEGGIGWIPYFRERIDYTFDRHRYWTGQDMGDRMPSQVFDEQVICCWIDDPVGIDMRHKMNIDKICWECDYPHSDSTWPTSPELLSKSLHGIPDAEVNQMTHENAMRFFQFDPFGHRPREQATVGALRAEAAGVDTSLRGSGKAPRDPSEGPITILDIVNAASANGATAAQ